MAFENIINFLKSSEYKTLYNLHMGHDPSAEETTENTLIRMTTAANGHKDLLSFASHLNSIGKNDVLSTFLDEVVADEKSTPGNKTVACYWLARLHKDEATTYISYLGKADIYSKTISNPAIIQYCADIKTRILPDDAKNVATENASQFKLGK